MFQTTFYSDLKAQVADLGGYLNAHLHLDRSHTLGADAHTAHLSLQQKHGLISGLHNGAEYEPSRLSTRLNQSLDEMVACNTRRADSVIDVTADGLGLRVLEQTQDIANARKRQIDFRRAVYSPLGFRDDEPDRWALFERGVELADFIGCLPERDDQTDYPDHIGYEENCRRMLDLANQRDLDLQVHVDQVNHPNENGTERLLDVIENERLAFGAADAPKIWAVHMISPSAYPQSRWEELVERLRASHVGVICCPSAALGMRQLRAIVAPTGNSIARVLDLCAAGLQVRLGSDNLADMLSPSTTADLTSEVFMLSAAMRFYNIEILAKLACGVVLSQADRETIRKHLDEDHLEAAKAIRRWGPVTS
ncbi:hypothetical protein OCA8868_02733 [Octadecabacter ascidiaceicola]|uniref:Uncharacterized protein n=1 Tax=Octadecabacter ascidiaceicola TaxID=1655543 RepID=A0A238KK48_9RHOB|nr:hypothetical protein OCA8868_02733 [Octadecabacter ascidiaceicola]